MVYFLVAITALMFGLYNIFIKLSASHIEAILGAVVLQFVAAFIGLALLAYMKFNGANIYSTPKGISLAICAGIAIGLVEILTFIIYGKGMPVAMGNPLIIGGSLIVTTGAGALLMREQLSSVQFLAILLITAGVGLMAWSAR